MVTAPDGWVAEGGDPPGRDAQPRKAEARRPGGSCPRCGAQMVHGTVGGRSTWWCFREQGGLAGSH